MAMAPHPPCPQVPLVVVSDCTPLFVMAPLSTFPQVPLIMVSDRINRRLKSDNWGNIIFWLSFCVVGQVCVGGEMGG